VLYRKIRLIFDTYLNFMHIKIIRLNNRTWFYNSRFPSPPLHARRRRLHRPTAAYTAHARCRALHAQRSGRPAVAIRGSILGGVGRHEAQCLLLTVVATLAFSVEAPCRLCACHDHRRCPLKSRHNHHSAYLNVVGGSIRVTPLRPVNSALIIMAGVPLCV
jgi:hypothetical protein